MSKVTVQDIEAVDDYWGPTFRSILEGKNWFYLKSVLFTPIGFVIPSQETIQNR